MASVVTGVALILLLNFVNSTLLDNEIEDLLKAKTTGKHWALIVAGSNGWYNYRHQADACHAYQILKNHGIPDERIVVMMYDDIANNEENPTPGIVINRPNGTDVYHGVPKDYTGEDVTPTNFISILTGDEEAMKGIGSGKVIKSGENDHVFVNFVDHGAPGIVAFPSGELHAKVLNKAIKSMYKNNQFAKMVLYIEACESGSMFKNLLPKDINVFATTAANSEESSYACYYDKKRRTYLGDVYSVKWMEDSDMENLNTETLKKQFRIVREETNTSHVKEYGDLSMGDMTVAEFQGTQSTKPISYEPVPLSAVPAPDVPLAILHHQLTDAKTSEERREILQKITTIQEKRFHLEEIMKHVVSVAVNDKHEHVHRILNSRSELTQYDCYQHAVEHFSQTCYKISENEYALRHLYKFVNLCEDKVPVAAIKEAMGKVCRTRKFKLLTGII